MNDIGEIRFLGEAQSIKIGQNSRVVISIPERIEPELHERIGKTAEEFFGPDVKVMVISGGMRFDVLEVAEPA